MSEDNIISTNKGIVEKNEEHKIDDSYKDLIWKFIKERGEKGMPTLSTDIQAFLKENQN